MTTVYNEGLAFREWRESGKNLHAVFGRLELFCDEKTVVQATLADPGQKYDPRLLPSPESADVAIEGRAIARLPFDELVRAGDRLMAKFGKGASTLTVPITTVVDALDPAEALKRHHPILLPCVSAAEDALRASLSPTTP